MAECTCGHCGHRFEAEPEWKHRVMCGDSGKAEDLDALLAGQRLNLIVTSPPYAEQRKEQYGGVPADEYGAWFLPMAALWKERLADDGSFFLNIKEHCEDGERHLYVKRLVIALREEGGWKFVDELCWEGKQFPGDMGKRFKNGWEPVFHFSKGADCRFNPMAVAIAGKEFDYDRLVNLSLGDGYDGHSPSAVKRDGMARPSNVLRMIVEGDNPGHAARFPVALPTFFLKAYSDPGDSVLDPFLGSGTTLIAAERQGRVCYGMEILPRYCDVILARWEQYTGEEAVLVQELPQTAHDVGLSEPNALQVQA